MIAKINKVEKKSRKKIDSIAARIALAPSSAKPGIVTIFATVPETHTASFRSAHDTPHTHAQQHGRRGREVVMTDAGAQRPVKQLL